MRPADFLFYLLGNRGSIERIAASGHAWAAGALLVLTAGIARNYDHLYLLRQGEAFYGPFLASLVTTLFIFWWAALVLKFRRDGRTGIQMRNFLALVWLTSPCAWIYAIPVEAWTDLLTATKWNVAFLAIVSAWRVALITRAVSVLTDVAWHRSLVAILTPAALEMAVGSWFRSLSLVGIMGGIRLSPHHKFLLDATHFTTIASFWIFVAGVLATFFIAGRKPGTQPLQRPPAEMRRSVFGVALALLILWAAAVIPMQRKVRNKYILEQHVQSDRYEDAAAFAANLSRHDFPAAHHLPPNPYARSFDPEFYLQLPSGTPEWLREEWRDNVRTGLRDHWILSAEEWVALQKQDPVLAAEFTARAEELRGKPRTAQAEYWLERFDAMREKAQRLPKFER